MAALPAGQWTYTSQYGWVWRPYAQDYTYVPVDSSGLYAYYPASGWGWLAAPWIYGGGPRPYWSHHGVSRFAWYSRPWFRTGGYNYSDRYGFRHAPLYGGGYRGGFGDHRGGCEDGRRSYRNGPGYRGAERHEYGSSGGGCRWSGGNRAAPRARKTYRAGLLRRGPRSRALSGRCHVVIGRRPLQELQPRWCSGPRALGARRSSSAASPPSRCA